jgi:hypothetical protein
MKKFLLAGILALILAVGLFFVFFLTQNKSIIPSMFESSKNQTQEETAQDIKASFAIFTNGTFRVFTASMYHELSPEVFINSENPNIVNIKRSETTWGDFFATLPMELDSSCLITGTGQEFCSDNDQTLKFYINGKNAPDALTQVINNGDQLLISFGNESELEIDEQILQIPNMD